MTLIQKEPKKIYKGSTEVKKIYIGNKRVWPNRTDRPDLTEFSLTSQVNTGLYNTHGICCSEDGKNIYISDANGPVNQYVCSDGTLSTFPSSATYTKSGIKTRGMYIKSDGSVLYSCVDGSPYTYTASMSTSYRIDTATVTNNSLPSNTKPTGCGWSPDGVYFYCGNWDNTNVPIYQYTCSTPRDLSSATLTRTQNLSATMGRNSYDIRFSPTGLKMYVGYRQRGTYGSGAIYQYNLSTAWDISTATYYTSMNFPAPSGTGTSGGEGTSFDFCNNGTRIFAHRVNLRGSTTNAYIYQYDA